MFRHNAECSNTYKFKIMIIKIIKTYATCFLNKFSSWITLENDISITFRNYYIVR